MEVGSKMKNFQLILSKAITVSMAIFIYFNPADEWFFKAFLYISMTLCIITYSLLFYDKEKDSPEYKEILKKRESKIYKNIDILFDLIYIIIFAFLNYKLIFVLQLINFFLNLSLYFPMNDEKEDRQENKDV